MAESEESKWLKNRYEEAATDSPSPAKRVKYQKLREEIEEQFPHKTFSDLVVHGLIKEAFPMSCTKRLGYQRHTHIVGIAAKDSHTSTSASRLEDVVELQKRAELAEKRLSEAEEENQRLKQRIDQLQKYSPLHLSEQLSTLTVPTNAVYHGPDTVEHFQKFTMPALISEFQDYAPDLLSLVMQLGQCDRLESVASSLELKAVMSLFTLVKCRSAKVLGIQLLITFMLIARSASRQTITTLNHAGVCGSYSSAWKYLQQLTMESGYDKVVQSDHWLWVYDNLNIHQKVRHEREDRHSKMLNLTTRLAVRIRNLPPWEFDWSDHTPQRHRDSLTLCDFLPTEEDAGELKKRAVKYVMKFMVAEFHALKDLEAFIQDDMAVREIPKTEVVPMKILFKDEKYIAETIDILSKLMEDAKLTGDPQVVIGDQLTCKNVRSSKMWRQPETNKEDRLTWVCESPGDFHFLWECLRVVFSVFWGTPAQPGSLCNLREIIRRTRVDKNVKVFNVGDEFLLHAFKSHLIASILQLFNIKEVTDSINHECSYQWLLDTADMIVSCVLMPKVSEDPVHTLHSAFLHLSYLYIDLREAIRWEEGPQIIRHWKLWLPRFVATGCKNYACESVHLLANLVASYPKHIAYIVTNNRTVNSRGKPGHGKPIDQHLEHYNLILKQTVRSAGANLTTKHLEEVSMSVLFLMEAAQKTDRAFGVSPQSSAHTTHDASKDILTMVNHLLDKDVTTEVADRRSPPFLDPTENGWKKLTKTWLRDTLERTSAGEYDLEADSEEVAATEEVDSFDVEYSLSDAF